MIESKCIKSGIEVIKVNAADKARYRCYEIHGSLRSEFWVRCCVGNCTTHSESD